MDTDETSDDMPRNTIEVARGDRSVHALYEAPAGHWLFFVGDREVTDSDLERMAERLEAHDQAMLWGVADWGAAGYRAFAEIWRRSRADS